MPEDLLAHYRILLPLGAGGMGEVYLAEDVHLLRKVALKFLPTAASGDSDANRRLLREARAAAKLDHPNVATIYEVGEANGRAFIAMQYVQGETLADRITRCRITPEEVVAISRDVLAALAAAHDAGIIHRDIKPQNVMITASGAKVLDFGLARMRDLDLGTNAPVTKTGVICGTVPYMSPEQLRGEPLDGRSDLFSLGIVMFEMLTGRRPFRGDSSAATIEAILFAPHPRIDISHPIGDVIDRVLQKDPGRRFADARAMSAALERLDGRGDVSFSAPTEEMGRRRARRARVASGSVHRVGKRATDLYAKARLQWEKRNPESLQTAVALLQQTIDIAPRFAPAYAALADCYNYLAFLEVVPPPDVVPSASAAAQKAIELDGSLAEPHAALGYVHMIYDWTWEEAEREFREALRLNRDYPPTPHWYCLMLALLQRFDEAAAHGEQAVRLDPLSPIISATPALIAMMAHRFEEAIRGFQNVLAIHPGFVPGDYYLGLCYEQLGRFSDAINVLEHACRVSPQGLMWLSALGHVYGAAGRRNDALAVLDDLRMRAQRQYVSPFSFGLVYLGLSQIDEAIVEFEKAFVERSSRFGNLLTDGRFREIRRDARFAALEQKHGLAFPQPAVSSR